MNMEMNEALLQELDYLVAQNLHEQLLNEVSHAKKVAPRNFSKFTPAQTLLQKLKEEKYADAIRLLSQNTDDEDPVEKMIRRLSQIKNPTKQGRGIKKAPHRRPYRRKIRDPLQLSLRLNKVGRHKKQKQEAKVQTKRKKNSQTVVTLTFPRFFVFQEMGFMLPVFPAAEC